MAVGGFMVHQELCRFISKKQTKKILRFTRNRTMIRESKDPLDSMENQVYYKERSLGQFMEL